MHHFARIGAVSNRAYRVVVAMGRAQPTEWGKLFTMGRAQPTEWGKRIGSVKKFDLIKRVMVCYIRKTFTSLEKFGSTSLKGELSVGALSKRAFTPFSSTSLKGELSVGALSKRALTPFGSISLKGERLCPV